VGVTEVVKSNDEVIFITEDGAYYQGENLHSDFAPDVPRNNLRIMKKLKDFNTLYIDAFNTIDSQFLNRCDDERFQNKVFQVLSTELAQKGSEFLESLLDRIKFHAGNILAADVQSGIPTLLRVTHAWKRPNGTYKIEANLVCKYVVVKLELDKISLSWIRARSVEHMALAFPCEAVISSEGKVETASVIPEKSELADLTQCTLQVYPIDTAGHVPVDVTIQDMLAGPMSTQRKYMAPAHAQSLLNALLGSTDRTLSGNSELPIFIRTAPVSVLRWWGFQVPTLKFTSLSDDIEANV
jgi:hypothetical protein